MSCGIREREERDGRTKWEWVQLEDRAAREKRGFGREARMGDEEAVDEAVDEVRG